MFLDFTNVILSYFVDDIDDDHDDDEQEEEEEEVEMIDDDNDKGGWVSLKDRIRAHLLCDKQVSCHTYIGYVSQ